MEALNLRLIDDQTLALWFEQAKAAISANELYTTITVSQKTAVKEREIKAIDLLNAVTFEIRRRRGDLTRKTLPRFL